MIFSLPSSFGDSTYLDLVPNNNVILDFSMGIVPIDDEQIKICNCYIHIYTTMIIYDAGKGSVPIIESTNIVKNGRVNSLNNGIVRGNFCFNLGFERK